MKMMDGLMSFADVEQRLVEAMLICWRMPDRERGWMRLRAYWPDVSAEAGDYDARGGDLRSSDVAIRPASLTRAEVAAMEEAFGWLDLVPAADRKLVGLAVTALARGAGQIPWLKLRAAMGVRYGAGGLAKRYERAIGEICRSVNGGFPDVQRVKRVNLA
jgi:hypothetical protein